MQCSKIIRFNSLMLIFLFFPLTLSCALNQPLSLSHALNQKVAGEWLIQQSPFAYHKILINTSRLDGLKGSVIASPSRSNPNYYYHWVRDAAITMDALINYDKYYANQNEQKVIRQSLFEYLDFSANIQNLRPIADLGEPRFHINASLVEGAWGRPQNDSPALRAISLIHFAKYLIAHGEMKIVKEKMYRAELPASLPIKKDLEYVSHHWQDPSYDLWEEVKGLHFYTLMVSRHALLEGALLAKQLKDPGASKWYFSQAKQIEQILPHFYDLKRGYFVATMNRVDGINYKFSELDTGVLLGLLHGDMQDDFFAWDDPRVINTMNKIIEFFSKAYPINQRSSIIGFAIGRYPEDKYDGTGVNEGNPWVICTFACAEAMYRYANTLKQKKMVDSAEKIRHLADQFVLRVKYHANADGSLSEQINRYTGFMTSALDLTWNYAALISTRMSLEGFNQQ